MSLRQEVVAALASPDLETRIRALNDAAAEDPEAYAALVVQQIVDYPRDGYFVLERIGRFGRAIIPCLRSLAAATTNDEVLILSTLGLAHFKDVSEADISVLIAAIRAQSEYHNLACRALAYLGIVSAGPVLVAELRATEPVEHHRITTLVLAIRGLGVEIAPEEVQRLTPPGTPFWISTLFDAGGTWP